MSRIRWESLIGVAAATSMLACSQAELTLPDGLDAGAAPRLGSAQNTPARYDTLQDIQPATITFPTAVGAAELLGVVRVTGRVNCTGTLIGAETVLTAAHCVCTEHYHLPWQECDSTATVTFRPNPGVGAPGEILGSVSVHAGYNPSPLTGSIEDDLAIITLSRIAPSYAPPVPVSQVFEPVNATIRVVGFGRTGSSCDMSSNGALSSMNTTIEDYTDNQHPMEHIVFADDAICPGDSGGPVLDAASQRVLAVNSTLGEVFSEQKACTTTQHFNWIKSHMCHSTPRNTCDGWGEPCGCSADNSILWQHTNGDIHMWFMAGGLIESSTSPPTPPSGVTVRGSGDFDGDGFDDLLLRNSNGQVVIWRMVAGMRLNSSSPGWPGLDWSIVGIADFDGNERSDILWRHSNGQLAIWPNGSETGALFPSYQNGGGPTNTSWTVVGVGDFGGDGKADILWRTNNLTDLAIWYMSGGTHIGEVSLVDPGSSFIVAGIANLDGDLRADVVWRDLTSGALLLWPGGFPVIGAPARTLSFDNSGSPPSFDWALLGMADFDHDGRDDLLWRQNSTGQIAVWIMEGTRVIADLYPSTVDSSWQMRALVHDDNN